MNACRPHLRYLFFIVPFLLASGCDNNTPCAPDTHLPIALADFDLGVLYVGRPVHFFDSDSYDPGGVMIVKFQWDWNNDGVWDESGRAVTHTWSEPGTYYVMFGVISADGETDTLNLPLEVVISPDAIPVAQARSDPDTQVAGEPVHFYDDGSYDPDGGVISVYEWDWNNDGIFDAAGEEQEYTWFDLGTYSVQFRVTDDDGQSGTLPEPLQVTIVEPEILHALDVTPEIPPLTPEASCASNGYLYVANAVNGLSILDLQNPAFPAWVGWTSVPGSDVYSGNAEDVAVSGNYAYVCAGVGDLVVVDVSSPEHPVVIQQLFMSGDPVDIEISGDHAFVTTHDTHNFGLNTAVVVVDISDPGNASIDRQISTVGDPIDISISGSYVYVALNYGSLEGGIMILDISVPGWAVTVATVPLQGWISGIDAEYPYLSVAYATAKNGYYYPKINIYSIDSPLSPELLQTVKLNSYGTPGKLQMADNSIYVAAMDDGLAVIDNSTPGSAFVSQVVDTPGYAMDVLVSEGYAYVVDHDYGAGIGGLTVIDVAPGSPAEYITTYNTTYWARGVCISNERAYVAAQEALVISGLSNPESPALAGMVQTHGYPRQVAVSGDYAYTADQSWLLGVVDITDSASPRLVGALYDGTSFHYAIDIAIAGNLACIAESDLSLVDITSPQEPQFIRRITTPGDTVAVEIAGSFAVTADMDSGVSAYDISSPSTVSEPVYQVDTPGTAYDVAVRGAYGYVADGDAGLTIIHAGPDGSASVVGTIDTPGSALGVVVRGPYAYVADNDAGLTIVDISSPDSPRLVSTIDTPGSAGDVAVWGRYAYLACGSSGLRIIRLW